MCANNRIPTILDLLTNDPGPEENELSFTFSNNNGPE